MGKTECDDEQMMTHISELLSQHSSEEKKDGEEEKDSRAREETMDVS